MKSIEKLLPEQQFKRVHRSFIVAAGAITAIKNNVLQIDKKEIPIGEKYRKEVVRFFTESGN
ncbi:MAG: LytTR family transcriptional regulator [Bacteroidetes bacterium]|nr:LytTR family transcriptional regulator [Bacteroidota bacterium]